MGKSGHSCGVAICRNTSINARNRGLKIRFFNFPKDPTLRTEWAVKCNRSDRTFNPATARICSEHFNDDDFEDALRAKLMGEVPIKLKKHGKNTD